MVTTCVLYTPIALVQAELGTDGGQRRARAVGTGGGRPVNETRVAVAQRWAYAAAANRL